jgi:hypothetical protein
MRFRILPDHQKNVLKKDILTVWSGKKRVLMHLRILPDHQKLFSKKIFLNVWSG